jgi:transcriptional regulator with XRE-family HTH domain
VATKRKPPTKSRTITAVFADRLREARAARGWTQTELSEALAAIGSPMDRTTIAKLEKAQRQVRLEELVALAVALDVSPLYLMFPLRLEEVVKLTPKTSLESRAAFKWANGQGPLNTRNERTYRFQSPGTWVIWTPGESDSPEFGGALPHAEAVEIATELERSDKKPKRASRKPA